MRWPAADAPALSVQRNVMLAFDDFMRRLDAVYVAQSAAAPPEFVDRISYWRDRCGLAAGVAHKLHQLRIWRNAATHHDAGKWAREGPHRGGGGSADRRVQRCCPVGGSYLQK